MQCQLGLYAGKHFEHNAMACRYNVEKLLQVFIKCFASSRKTNHDYKLKVVIVYKVITTMVIRPLDDPHDLLNLWSPIYGPSVWVHGDRG